MNIDFKQFSWGWGLIPLIVICIFVTIALYCTERSGYKRGYEDAVLDFYRGKLKCEIVETKVLIVKWKCEK